MTKDLHKTPFNKEFRWNTWKKISDLVPERSWTWQNVRTGKAGGADWVEQQIYFDMLFLAGLNDTAKVTPV